MTTRLLVAVLMEAAFGLLLAACGTFEPSEPFARFHPPDSYRVMWDSVWTHCGSKVRGRPDKEFDQVEFYKVDASSFRTPVGLAAGAYTNGRVYLARPYLDSEFVVKHELLHAMLTEHVGHPPIFSTCGLTRTDAS